MRQTSVATSWVYLRSTGAGQGYSPGRRSGFGALAYTRCGEASSVIPGRQSRRIRRQIICNGLGRIRQSHRSLILGLNAMKDFARQIWAKRFRPTALRPSPVITSAHFASCARRPLPLSCSFAARN